MRLIEVHQKAKIKYTKRGCVVLQPVAKVYCIPVNEKEFGPLPRIGPPLYVLSNTLRWNKEQNTFFRTKRRMKMPNDTEKKHKIGIVEYENANLIFIVAEDNYNYYYNRNFDIVEEDPDGNAKLLGYFAAEAFRKDHADKIQALSIG